MNVLDAESLASFAQYLGEVKWWAKEQQGEVSLDVKKSVRENLEGNRPYAEKLSLDLTLDQLDRVGRATEKDILTFETLAVLVDELASRFTDELSHRLCLTIPQENAKRIGPASELFGEAVADRFAPANSDIEEAGFCLAFRRSTGCVFHLMRVMEVGLKSVAVSLEIPYAPSWESYIKQIQTSIDSDWKKKTKQWKQHEPFFRDTLAHLHAVKVAWRNPTMHIVNHYTSDQAEDVYNAVRGFMRHLAEKMPTTKQELKAQKDIAKSLASSSSGDASS